MILGTKLKTALSLALAATLCMALFSPQATAAPILGLQMQRTHTPLNRGDERLVYELTVKNEASANPSVGDELSCAGAPGGNPTSTITFKWLRNGTPIPGATSPTYTVTAEDEGQSIQCMVTGTNEPAGGPPTYGPVSTVGISLPPVVVEPVPVNAPPNGGTRPSISAASASMASTPSGTATSEAGSAILSDVVASKGTGTFTNGSPVVEGVTMGSGFFQPSAVAGSCVAPESTITKVEEPTPGSGVLRVTLSKAATCSAPAGMLEAGAFPFSLGQVVSGECVPGGAKVVKATQQGGGSPTIRFIELDKAATCSKIGMAITATSTLVCQAPTGWSAGSTITWSFQWLRNGQPIPGATSANYTVQGADTTPPSSLQCEATAEDEDGNGAIAVAGPRSTSPPPPNPYMPPHTFAPTLSFANQTTGPITLQFEPQGGLQTPVFAVRSLGAWDCEKQAPTPVEDSFVSCERSDSLAPNNSFAPVEVIVAVSENAPDVVAASARAFGGGAAEEPTAADQFTLGPPIPWEFDAFEAKATDDLGNDYVLAGGHPYAAGAEFSFTDHETVEKSGFGFTRTPNALVRTVETDIPPGFTGNPQAPPEHCPSVADVIHTPGQTTCPAGSVVGGITLHTSIQTFEDVPIYSLKPEEGAPAEFAFGLAENNLVFALVPELRAENGYAVTLLSAPIVKSPEVFGAEAILCGFGGKLGVKITGESKFNGCKKSQEGGANPIPFLTNPTRCEGGPPITRIAADTWEEPGTFIEAKDPAEPVEGCENLPFEPEIEAKPTTNRADSPTGLEFNLHIPQNEDPEGVATAHLRKTVVTLPEGLVVNPSGANGLGACTEAQLGMANGVPDDDPVQCPDASKIGSVTVTTPLLDHTLPGSLYVAMPHQNPFGSLIALYLTVESPKDGVTIKLAGKTEANPTTGQLTTSFDQNPQAPVEDVQLKVRSGAGAPLRTPTSCAKYTVASSLTPWSAPQSGPPASAKDTWQISRGPSGGACASSQPNSPSFEAGSASAIAAIHSPFLVKLRREDGTQRFSQLTVSPPPGVLAKLAGTSRCSDAALAGAQAKSGREEQSSPSCPASSELGSVIAAAGAGPAPFQASGRAYLAGPYKGAPLSIAILTPAVAGPFDLGVVVVRAAVYVNPTTAQVTVKSDPLPQILEGIPLDIRAANVAIDRPNFVLNPTSCDPMAVNGQLLSTLGNAAALSNRFQLAECGRLAFKPKLKLRLKGKTNRGAYQGLKATLTAKPGEANIASASVTLPRSAFVAQEHINTVCTRVQFAADACPKGSIYGKAKAITPLLEDPLSGPVYLRSSDNELPDLVIALKGPDHLPIEVELAGRVDSVKGALRNTFELVPDAPVSKFTLEMFGGRKGLIVNSRNLCAKAQRASIEMTAQNGKVFSATPVTANECRKGRKARKGKRRR